MLAAVLAAVPPYRANGDEAVVSRLIRRPNSAMEAAARAPAELVLGFAAAAGGLLMDPISVSWRRQLEQPVLFSAGALERRPCGLALRPALFRPSSPAAAAAALSLFTHLPRTDRAGSRAATPAPWPAS